MSAKNMDKALMDQRLWELSKELKKDFGRKAKIELIIIGGAAIALNHSFRESTTDIDALISEGMNNIKGAINRVADNNGIPSDWLNSDFKNTASYSPEIIRYSKLYKTFNQILNVRVVKDEYLIAMKMRSFRQYKNDISDIVGLISENPEITMEDIKIACNNLYGSTECVSKEAWDFLQNTIDHKYDYENIRDQEKENKIALIEFNDQYNDVLKEDNVNDILATLKSKIQTQANEIDNIEKEKKI